MPRKTVLCRKCRKRLADQRRAYFREYQRRRRKLLASPGIRSLLAYKEPPSVLDRVLSGPFDPIEIVPGSSRAKARRAKEGE